MTNFKMIDFSVHKNNWKKHRACITDNFRCEFYGGGISTFRLTKTIVTQKITKCSK